MDITSPHPQTHSIGGAKDWLVVLDDATDNAWNFFLPKKSCLSDTVLVLIKDIWVRYKMRVKIIRCDNAGENMAFMRAAQYERLGLKFEFTAPGTPQQNGHVERKFKHSTDV